MITARSTREPLSVALREQTRIIHQQAETAPFVDALLSGALPLSAYSALVAQNYAIYCTLETAAERWRDDPVAGPFVLDQLTRLPRLAADLRDLLGPSWRHGCDRLQVPATDHYVAHLEDFGTQWPGGFIAHHYVRYLGDLSGGQIIRSNISRIYGDDGHRSTRFYTFETIETIDKIKPFRDRCRHLLDQAPLSVSDQQQVVDEAIVAFELNRTVFLDLGDHYVRASTDPADMYRPGGDHKRV